MIGNASGTSAATTPAAAIPHAAAPTAPRITSRLLCVALINLPARINEQPQLRRRQVRTAVLREQLRPPERLRYVPADDRLKEVRLVPNQVDQPGRHARERPADIDDRRPVRPLPEI